MVAFKWTQTSSNNVICKKDNSFNKHSYRLIIILPVLSKLFDRFTRPSILRSIRPSVLSLRLYTTENTMWFYAMFY